MSNKKATQREVAEKNSQKNENAVEINHQDEIRASESSAKEQPSKVESAAPLGIVEPLEGETGEGKAGEGETGGNETAQSEAGQLDELRQRVAGLEGEKQEWKESLLRKQADLENTRRRMQKDKEDAIQFANRSLMGDLLEVLDNFERALSSHREQKESSAETKSLFEGLELVEKQLSELLCSRGLKAMDSLGAEFDPNIHEALMMEEGADCEAPTVVENFQTGYTLHGRVLRPARVKVAKPAG